MGMLVPILPGYAASLGAGPGQVGILLAASTFAGIVLAVPAAVTAARVGHRRLLIATPLLAAPASALCGLISAFWSLAVFCIAEGALSGIYATVGTALVASGRDHRSGRAIGLYQGAALLGASIGPALGGSLGAQHIRGLFLLNAALSLAVAAWLAARLPASESVAPREAEHPPQRVAWRSFATPALLGLWFFAFALAFAQFGTQWVTAPFLGAGKFGFGPQRIGATMALSAAAALAAFYPAGWLADRKGRLPVVTAGALGTVVALLLFAAATDYRTFTLAAITLGIAGAFTGTAPIAHLSHALPDDARTLGVGLYRLAAGLGGTLAPILLGSLVAGAAFVPALLATAALVSVAVALFLLVQASPSAHDRV